MNTGCTFNIINKCSMKEGLRILLITLEGGTQLLAVYPSKQRDKMPFEHFYKQSDAIKFSSRLIRLSKQDTKKPIRSWASCQIFFPAAHRFPEVIPPLPSIKSPNNGYVHYLCKGLSQCFRDLRWKGHGLLQASAVLVSSRSISYF